MEPQYRHTGHRPSPSIGREREKGLALLAVLWIIASGTLLVASFNVAVRSGLSFIRSEVQLTRTDALLDAGLEIAATRLIDEDAARRWHPDGRWRDIGFADSKLRIRIQDPNGLIDLNKADEALLMAFFRHFAANAAEAKLITERIIIARGEKPGTGALTGDRPANANSAARAAFMDVGQLRQIEGMRIELFRAVAPFMTVFSHDGSVNPLTAPEDVFLATPASRDVATRAQRDVFTAARNGTGSASALADVEADQFGPAYTVSVEAEMAGSAYRARKTFVIATGLDATVPYSVLSIRPETN